ncbi:XRE family transcriptional regulator [Pseudomonas sp. NFACC04-2]|uniref:XRE family transcriptional regulator n=1 Tax=Pseudomonas sp. NFACC04-2 TaxID=1566242 RepID=UPI0009087C03|nr:XRE family transcriptional regulator [Pseudomonas sp. NFACC04-2]SFW77504.1 Peptidase S24-like [Pseudomonas sp. NFACC04-2]
MDIKDIRRFRLRKLLLTRFRSKQSALADAIGRSPSYVARIFSDKPEHSRNIGEALAREIESLCGLPAGFLDQPLSNVEEAGFYDPQTNPPGIDSSKLPQMFSHQVAIFNDKVAIPLLKVSAPASDEAPQEIDSAVTSITLDKSWIQRTLGLNDVSLLRLAMGMGDSMAPSIKNGDLLIVDTASTSITYDAVYMLYIGGQLSVKRVQAEVDGVRIISDNPKFKEVMVPSDMVHHLKILGRVAYVWSGSQP